MSEKKNVVSTAADAPAVEKTARKTAKADKAAKTTCLLYTSDAADE